MDKFDVAAVFRSQSDHIISLLKEMWPKFVSKIAGRR